MSLTERNMMLLIELANKIPSSRFTKSQFELRQSGNVTLLLNTIRAPAMEYSASCNTLRMSAEYQSGYVEHDNVDRLSKTSATDIMATRRQRLITVLLITIERVAWV